MLFAHERELALAPDAGTGFITLDISKQLGCGYPATTPFMLARYLVLEAESSFRHNLQTSGEIYYVISGSGYSANGADHIFWSTGDAFCFPGGGTTTHDAARRSVLFLVTNEPELAFGGYAPPQRNRSQVKTALFSQARVDAALAALQDGSNNEAVADYVNITTAGLQRMRTILPSIVVGFNRLLPGSTQRPHRHNATAITLSIQGNGCQTTVNGERFEWLPHGVLLTPPNAVHSHYNSGPSPMKSLVAQDGGLFHYCRATGFEYCD
jgi:gentisate 1,2-dioxygenase